MSRVSVVIPCRKNAPYIARAIYSCFKQNDLLEIIVVDDGSNGSGREQLRSLCTDFPVVRVLGYDKGVTSGADRNAGAREAVGEFVCFLDSDDDLLSGYFSAALAELDVCPQFSAIKVGMQFVDEGYEPIVLPGDPRYLALLASSSCNLMFRREAFERLGGFPEDVRFAGPLGGEDAAFSRAVETYLSPIGYLPEAFYRVHSQQGSNLHKFLANTQVIDASSFNFISVLPEQQADGLLGGAIDDYLAGVGKRVNG